MSLDNPLPRAAKIAGYIAAFAGAIIAVGTAWTMLDLPVFATRAYVDSKDNTIGDTVVELARGQRDRLKRTRDTVVSRLTAATDPQVKIDLQQLVEQANADVTEIEKHITELERMRGK